MRLLFGCLRSVVHLQCWRGAKSLTAEMSEPKCDRFALGIETESLKRHIIQKQCKKLAFTSAVSLFLALP